MTMLYALFCWSVLHMVGCSYHTLKVHIFGMKDEILNITSVQIYHNGKTVSIGVKLISHSCQRDFVPNMYEAGSNLVDADSICGQDTNECFPIVMPKHFSTILFQRFRCHTSLQYPVHVVRKYIESKLLKMQDIFVQVIEDLMWGSLVLFYETRSRNLADRIVNDVSENGVHVIMLNVDTKSHKDLVEFIIDAFHNVQNMSIVCSNICIGRIITMVNNMDMTNLDPGALLQRETKWIVLSVDGSSSYMLPTNASNITNIAIIEKTRTYPNLCNDYQTIWYEDKYWSRYNITSKEEQLYLNALALTLVGNVYSSSTYRLQTLVFTALGRELKEVKWAYNDSAFFLETDLFPNIKYGFNKKELLVSMLEWRPFTIKSKDGNYTGFTVIVLDRLAYQLNFTYKIVEPEDGQWGVRLNGSWTGMIGLLEDRKVDLVAAALTVTYERELSIDFLYPIFFDTNRIIIKRPGDEEEKWRTLIDIYNEMVLLYIGLSLVFVTVFLCVVEKINPFFSMEVNKNKSRLRTFSDCFWYNYGALLTQGGTNTPDDHTGRTVLSYWWIFCMVSMAIYSGNLVAFLTVSEDKLPFETIEQMVKQDKYKWGLYGNGAMQSFFSESTVASHQRVWNKIVEFNRSDPTTLSSSEDVQYGKVTEGQYAYFGVDGVAKYYQSKGMDIQILPEVVAVIPNAFALQKDSPYERIFSREIMRMHENGLLEMWLKAGYKITKTKDDKLKAKTITMEDLQSAFYLVGIGVTAGIVTYILEAVIHRCRCRLRRQKEHVALKRLESFDLSAIS